MSVKGIDGNPTEEEVPGSDSSAVGKRAIKPITQEKRSARWKGFGGHGVD